MLWGLGRKRLGCGRNLGFIGFLAMWHILGVHGFFVRWLLEARAGPLATHLVLVLERWGKALFVLGCWFLPCEIEGQNFGWRTFVIVDDWGFGLLQTFWGVILLRRVTDVQSLEAWFIMEQKLWSFEVEVLGFWGQRKEQSLETWISAIVEVLGTKFGWYNLNLFIYRVSKFQVHWSYTSEVVLVFALGL